MIWIGVCEIYISGYLLQQDEHTRQDDLMSWSLEIVSRLALKRHLHYKGESFLKVSQIPLTVCEKYTRYFLFLSGERVRETDGKKKGERVGETDGGG